METQNRVFFERLMQEFDTLLDYTFEEVPKLNLLKITTIQREHGTSIYHTDHIIRNIMQ